jgi:hypothetical protein
MNLVFIMELICNFKKYVHFHLTQILSSIFHSFAFDPVYPIDLLNSLTTYFRAIFSEANFPKWKALSRVNGRINISNIAPTNNVTTAQAKPR